MERINVTKTYIGDKQGFLKLTADILDSHWLTNHGPKVTELERELKRYLDVPYLFFVNNGTIALQIAIKALGLTGKVVTTPFSYVATTSSLVWENCDPVFADIDEKTLTIDVNEVEKHLDLGATGILATHVYGIPCDIFGLKELGKKYGVPVIYDAAHAFGVKYANESICNFGDISTLSFHATKLFHTIEGGAIITSDPELAHKISYLRNFGHDGPEHFFGLGINGKCNEIQAAMGLVNLSHVQQIIKERKELFNYYLKVLNQPSIKIISPINLEGHNFSYFPVLFQSEEELIKKKEEMESHNIFPRRYFYPSLNSLPYLKYQACPNAESISKRILCLPFYNGLAVQDIDRIAEIINSSR